MQRRTLKESEQLLFYIRLTTRPRPSVPAATAASTTRKWQRHPWEDVITTDIFRLSNSCSRYNPEFDDPVQAPAPPNGTTIRYLSQPCCSIKGCKERNNIVLCSRDGVCETHYNAIYYDKGRCSIPKCVGCVERDGLCESHAPREEKKPYKRERDICKITGCKKFSRMGGVCFRHGEDNRIFFCSIEGCTKWVQNEGLCVKHGAKVKCCSYEGCTKQVVRGGRCKHHPERFDNMYCSMCCKQGTMQKQGETFFCMKFPCASHNGKGVTCTAKGCKLFIPTLEERKDQSGKEIHEWFCGRHWNLAYDGYMNRQAIRQCMQQGCVNDELQGGLCLSHGANTKICNHPGGCTHKVRDGGVCARHGASRRAVRKTCNHDGCTKLAQNEGLCVEHGAKVKRCSRDGCTNQVVKGGVCRRHWRHSGGL